MRRSPPVHSPSFFWLLWIFLLAFWFLTIWSGVRLAPSIILNGSTPLQQRTFFGKQESDDQKRKQITILKPQFTLWLSSYLKTRLHKFAATAVYVAILGRSYTRDTGFLGRCRRWPLCYFVDGRPGEATLISGCMRLMACRLWWRSAWMSLLRSILGIVIFQQILIQKYMTSLV